MKNKMESLSSQLKVLHRRFLENEKIEAEKKMNRSLSAFDFFHLLTKDPNFSWLRPFSALLAEMDAFIDEKTEITPDDLALWHERITQTLHVADSPIASRLRHYQKQDAELALDAEKFQKLLNALVNKGEGLH